MFEKYKALGKPMPIATAIAKDREWKIRKGFNLYSLFGKLVQRRRSIRDIISRDKVEGILKANRLAIN